MRSALIILFFLPLFSFSQREWNVNIGAEFSYFNTYEYLEGSTKAYNISVNYRTIELSIGLCAYDIPSFKSPVRYDIQWTSFTLKHHFAVGRRSHGFLLLNYQGRDYVLNLLRAPVNTKYKDDYGNEVIARSDNFHFGLGLEPILWDRLAFPISLGAGIVHHKGTELELPQNFGRYFYAFDKWEFSPFVSIGLRLYLFKRDIYGTHSDSQFF